MLRLVEDAKEKRAAQAALEARIHERLAHQGVRNIGYPSGNTNEVLYANTSGDLWAAFAKHDKAPVPRQWNAFGVFDSKRQAQVITVEINVPTAGNSARVAGFFARDPVNDRVYLMHDGSVGGGKPGVGRSAFLYWTKAQTVDVVRSDGVVRTGIIVGAVEVDDFVSRLRRFVNQVRRFKVDVGAGKLDTPEVGEAIAEWETFSSESPGRRQGQRSSTIDYVSYHGEVVERLFEEREARRRTSEKVANNRLIDLYVRRDGVMTEIYEVKTSTDRQAIYTAIGQLITHSTPAPPGVVRTLVLPEGNLSDDLSQALVSMGIGLRRFTITGGETPIVVLSPEPPRFDVAVRPTARPRGKGR